MNTNEILEETKLKTKVKAPANKAQRKRRIIEFLVVAVVITFGFWWVLPKSRMLEASDLFDAAKVEAQTKEVIQLLDEGDYDALREMSVEKFAPMINEEQMEAARDNLATDWGKLKDYEFKPFLESVQRGQHSAIANVKVIYENTEVAYMISFNKTMKLNGLQMGRAENK